MNGQEMFNAINKGVPNYIPIEINIKTLVEQCASDAEQLKAEFAMISQLYKEYIISNSDFTKANEDFLICLRTRTNYKNAQTNIFNSSTFSNISFLKFRSLKSTEGFEMLKICFNLCK